MLRDISKIKAWLESHVYLICFLSIAVFCFAAALYHNTAKLCDIMLYNLPWVRYFNTHSVLHMYDTVFFGNAQNIPPINYPPFFPVWLCLIRPAVLYAEKAGWQNLLYLVIKSFGLVCHAFILLFFCIRKQKKSALFWALCPAWLVLTGFWGQTDEAFSFLIWVMLEGLDCENFYESGIAAALSCLLKTQGVFCVIIWLVFLVMSKKDLPDKRKAFTAALLTGVLFWLPFMVSYRSVLIPIRFYLKAGSGNSSLSSAANFWFIPGLAVGFNLPSGIFTAGVFIFLAAGCVLVVISYKNGRSSAVSVFVYLAFLYSFMLGQHERYIVYPMTALCFLWIVKDYNVKARMYSIIYIICASCVCISRMWAEAGYTDPEHLGMSYWAMIMIYLAAAFTTTWICVELLQKYCKRNGTVNPISGTNQ